MRLFLTDAGYRKFQDRQKKGEIKIEDQLPEDWDYTTKGLACICKDGVDSITSALKELENHGYLTRQRTRYENGRLGDITYTIHEKPVGQDEKEELPEPVNHAQLNTEQSNTDGLNTYQSIYLAEPEAASCHDGMDRMELADAYRQIICENIEYDILAERHGKQRMDEAVELMLEVVLSKRPYIRIAGDDFPREVVRSRILKINSSHLEYVFATMDSYYRAEVNHDLYGT